MITYEQLTSRYNLVQIAVALGYCKETDPLAVRRAAAARVGNWKRTGIPPRALKKKAAEFAILTSEEGLPSLGQFLKDNAEFTEQQEKEFNELRAEIREKLLKKDKDKELSTLLPEAQPEAAR